MKHRPVHLRCDLKRDVHVYRHKRRSTYVLKVDYGGKYCGTTVPETLCGASRARYLVEIHEKERVTCPLCLRIMRVRFPQDHANPRSGMKMPRPGTTNEDRKE